MALQPTYVIEEKSSILHTEREIVCSILFGRNYISYAFSNPERDTIYMVKHFDLLQNVLGKSDFDEMLFDLFIKKASSVRLAIDSQKITLLPASTFKNTEVDMLSLIYQIWPEEQIYIRQNKDQYISQYALKKATIDFLKKRLPHLEIVDSTFPLLQSYPKQCLHDTEWNVFIAVKEEHFYFSVYQKPDQLKIHQVCNYQKAEDVLFVIAQFVNIQQLDPDKIGVQVHGELNSTQSILELLKKYYPFTRQISRIKSLLYPEDLYAHPSHYFFNIFSLVTCEL